MKKDTQIQALYDFRQFLLTSCSVSSFQIEDGKRLITQNILMHMDNVKVNLVWKMQHKFMLPNDLLYLHVYHAAYHSGSFLLPLHILGNPFTSRQCAETV